LIKRRIYSRLGFLRRGLRRLMREQRSGILVLFALFVGTAAAKGAPPLNADPALSPWFESLQRPDGAGSCCSTADCRRVQSRLHDKGYEVLLDEIWVAVPPGKVLHRDNPTGDAVACTRGHLIFCFVPAPDV
jgi:hypothetical protein